MGEYETALELAGGEHPDLSQVYTLLNKAIEDGDDRAKYAIASWYLNGNELIEKNVKVGTNLLKDLQKSNIAEALFDLAVSYDHGWHVRRHEAKAFSLYMRAALLGHKESCKQVSEFYREGKLVNFDRRLSAAWQQRSQEDEKLIAPPYRLWLR